MKSTKTIVSADAYMKTVLKDYGPVTAIRAVTQRFKSLPRADVLDIAKKHKVNVHTASRQFHESRSGRVQISLKK